MYAFNADLVKIYCQAGYDKSGNDSYLRDVYLELYVSLKGRMYYMAFCNMRILISLDVHNDKFF